MTPGSPDEALHFRGKTLTPESPRPLHITEPSNIPLLQNQMDLVYNDTSTYYDTLHEDSSQEHHHGQYAGPEDVRGPAHPHYQQPLHTQVTAKPSLLSVQSASAAESSSIIQDIAPNSSLTTLPPSDPAALLAHPKPDGPFSASQAPQTIHVANEVTHNVASWTAQSAPHGRLDIQEQPEDNTGDDGVDFQNLLDNLPPPSSAAAVSETAPSSANDVSAAPQSLPPRPPLQEQPSVYSNYNPNGDIHSYHLPPHASNASTSYASQSSNYHSSLGPPPLAGTGAPGTSSGTSALPPPPGPSFQQSPPSTTEAQEPPTPVTSKNGRIDRQAGRQSKPAEEDAFWGTEVQRIYDEFLHDERVYVTEGLWDRFPPGSRLFVGNLPTERVTKRDLFHIFHKYGKLAQISIKQAYGFIQFLEPSACKQSLDAEQGVVIRGRKIHLEISKPQRNTRPGPAAPEPSRGPPLGRSRSPEYRPGPPGSRNQRIPGDRYDRLYESARVPFSDFRDEPTHRRRDDYRPPPRSPSPRPFRGRDGYKSRDRTPERYDRRERRRSRSPYGRDRRYRTPSPRGRGAYDSDADLPVPRRAPRDVPEVQILVLEEIDRNFIFHVENAFRNRGLRVDVLVLGPRIPLNAAVQRQMNEGVLAVVRLSRPTQFSRKIPLQVFDRSAGTDNIRFNEYPDLEPNIAAEIVFHAHSMQRGGPSATFPSNPSNPAFTIPTLPTASIPQASLPALANPPNVANMISSLDGPTLHSLLTALQQRQQPVPTVQPPFPVVSAPNSTADLAGLLSSVSRQPIPSHPAQPLPPQPYSLPTPNGQVVPDPNLMSLLAKGLGGQPQQSQATMAPQVQNIMNQLSRWKQ